MKLSDIQIEFLEFMLTGRGILLYDNSEPEKEEMQQLINFGIVAKIKGKNIYMIPTLKINQVEGLLKI